MKNNIFILIFSYLFASCTGDGINPQQSELQEFLNDYNRKYQELLYAQNEAQWQMQTHIVDGDTMAAYKAGLADKAMSDFLGSNNNLIKAQEFLKNKSVLSDIQIRQLNTIVFLAGGSPEAAKEIVNEKIKVQNEQIQKLYSFKYVLNGDTISTNKIEEILRAENNINNRLAAWNVSKDVGKGLKEGLIKLRELRNKSVEPLGYKDFFTYQVSEYNMTADELMKICNDMIRDVWPIYRELHTWARYELAKKYNQPVPDMLPAHWLPNRWGQDWTAMIQVEGFNIDSALQTKSAGWIMKEGEAFYMSLGFEKLPDVFWEKSSLYPLPPNAGYSKNNHASAWHFNNDRDVRSLMSVEPNSEWWETVLHELGHIYYFLEYSKPDVPIILRNGANRAYHEAFGTQIGLASMQKAFLQERGLVSKNVKVDSIKVLLKEALSYVVVIPWAAGVMTGFEYELYSNNLSPDRFNAKWWELVEKYQGIVPPSDRGEEYCDAATKTHINDDPAQYYDYAMSNLLLFQFHVHVAKNILKQDPHNTNYWGNKEVGNFLKKLMRPGASVDWREHLKNSIGEEMSAKAMAEYFSPLLTYLKEVNKGRTHTLPETID